MFFRRRPSPTPPLVRVELEPVVAHRFNAYAAGAWPREVGGLLRIERHGDLLRATGLRLFPHTRATGSYFELDGETVAAFLLDLVRSGRRAEVGQWRGLIHSHPNMEPFLSGTDQENLWRLAGADWAVSVICAAREDPERNAYAAHYAQTAPARYLLRDLPVSASARALAGTASLSAQERAWAEREALHALAGHRGADTVDSLRSRVKDPR